MTGDKRERKALVDYLSSFTRRFAEMKEIMRVEEPEMLELDASVPGAMDSAFIEDCDESTLSWYANRAGVVLNPGETAEQKRRRVLAAWQQMESYVYRALLKKMDILCGADGYLIEQKDYTLDVMVYDDWAVDAVVKMLEEFLPVNIAYTVPLGAVYAIKNYAAAVLQDDEVVDFKQLV